MQHETGRLHDDRTLHRTDGVEDGKIRVNDPNSRVRSGKLWDYSRLEYQINNLWVYTAM